MKIKAVIFDMDGVIIDSEPVYLNHLASFLYENDIKVPHNELCKIVGRSSKKTFQLIENYWYGRFTSDELESMYLDFSKDFRVDYNLIINSNIKGVLQFLKEQGYLIALASSSSLKNINTVLKTCKITHFFDQVVSGEMFTESKPNPEIYNYTMKQLNCSPAECVAIEDSTVGIEAAKNSGLIVVAKRDDRFNFHQESADYIINDASEILTIIEKTYNQLEVLA